MIKMAIYGKGGIGKSTTASNLSLAFREKGYNVLQVGCDPKADSTLLLRNGKKLTTILDQFRENGPDGFSLDDIVIQGTNGVYISEAGGPPPGLGCAGRGIVTALKELEKRKVFEEKNIDIVIYDVLGDVVCGGFSMPIRDGYAKDVFIVTSGENMAIHAAKNIALAVDNFKDRGYARVGGVILNKRNVSNEESKINDLCEFIDSPKVGVLSFSSEVQKADEVEKTVMEIAPNSEMANEYRILCDSVLAAC
ncbi:MAG: AAA family ATPase, partial [Spirochaetaceae bacterium]|nr:AAA family ATPase [Spirochaetaceae bacterium]